jgi:2-keto-4-pentenoate hydratase
VRLYVDGGCRAEVHVSPMLPERVGALCGLLGAVGQRLAPGDRILAGSLTHVPIVAGDHVVAEIDGLGRVELRCTTRVR